MTKKLPECLLWDLQEVAAVLGVAMRTVQHWQRFGRMPPCIRLGRSPRWRVEEIRQWVSDGCPTCTETQDDEIQDSEIDESEVSE